MTTKRHNKFNCPVIARLMDQDNHRGLAPKIAAELGITRSAVAMWPSVGQVPAEHVIRVGEFLRVARHRIRPDLYPE